MNKLTIIGNLTRDPELRTTSGGVPVCTFTVAVNRKRAGKDGESEADFFNVTAWRERGEVCAKYLAKGKKVCVIGPVAVRTYTNKNGQFGANMDVIADDVEFLSPRSEQDQKPAAPTYGNYTSDGGFLPVEMDDLPFN